MKTSQFFSSFVLLVRTTFCVVVATNPVTITSTYDDFDYGGGLSAPGILAVSLVSPLIRYDDLKYSAVLIFKMEETQTSIPLTGRPSDTTGVVIVDASIISIPEVTSKIRAFSPESADLSMFVVTAASVHVAVYGKITATVTDTNGAKYTKDCEIRLIDGGKAKPCAFPSEWQSLQIISMSFKIKEATASGLSNGLQEIKGSLGFQDIVGGGVGATGATGIIMDNLKFKAICADNFRNDGATGKCEGLED